jgi:aconitase A
MAPSRSTNSFGARAQLEVGRRRFEVFRLDSLHPRFDVARLPFSLKTLLENLLRSVRVRIDTPNEAAYFRHGGILQYVLRQLLTPNPPRHSARTS